MQNEHIIVLTMDGLVHFWEQDTPEIRWLLDEETITEQVTCHCDDDVCSPEEMHMWREQLAQGKVVSHVEPMGK